MKYSLPVLVAAMVGLAVATEPTQPVVNRTVANTVTNGTKIGVHATVCNARRGDAVPSWYYNSKSDGPHRCKPEGNGAWVMLSAYRSGGAQGVHCKYTTDPNDRECLSNWRYYEADGVTLIGTIPGRITTVNERSSWCATTVYRSGGVKGNQWADCECTSPDPVRPGHPPESFTP